MWKPLIYNNVDYGKNYEISEYGEIRSLITGRILAKTKNEKGYFQTSIKGKCIKIHRAVAINFVDGYKEGLEVNHKDGNKENNHFNNLEWCTHKQNVKHSVDKELRGKLIGVICKESGKYFESCKRASEEYGIDYDKLLYHFSKYGKYEIKENEITLIPNKESNYMKNRKLKDKCPVCGKEKHITSSVCKKCFSCSQRKKIPSKEEITELFLGGNSFDLIGKKFGVTGNAVRKWCKKYKLPIKTKEWKEIIKTY